MNFSNQPFHPLKDEKDMIELVFKKSQCLEALPTIPEFYAGKELFVTGFTGFMGKVLIEKLLRSCPDIKAIYVLLRPKKGNSIGERLKAVTDLPLFEPLKKHSPEVFKKLIPINGDVTELQLGMAQDDIERMKNVSIIFHSAASVRFDDTLKYAVLMNTRGTREVMKFAEQLINIKVVVHVSTTYSNPDRHTVDEEIYPPVADWRKTIEICEEMDEDTLNNLTPHFIGFMPNTYTFTKNLAEHVIQDYKGKVPSLVFRPSIVISTMSDPFPGWVDNFNGPVGMLVGSGLGIIRTMYCNPDNRADFLPVDVCIKAMIVAAWKRAHQSRNSLPVYNCASSNLINITLEQITDLGKCITESTPLDRMLWTPGGRPTLCRPLNFVKTIFLQLLPAMLVDVALRIHGSKPFLTKIQRKVYEANLALQHFVLNEWLFKNDNFIALTDQLKVEDLKAFDYRGSFDSDIILYLRYALVGVRRYLLKDKDENIPRNRIIYRRLKLLNSFLKTLPWVFVIYFAFFKHDLIHSIKIKYGL